MQSAGIDKPDFFVFFPVKERGIEVQMLHYLIGEVRFVQRLYPWQNHGMALLKAERLLESQNKVFLHPQRVSFWIKT